MKFIMQEAQEKAAEIGVSAEEEVSLQEMLDKLVNIIDGRPVFTRGRVAVGNYALRLSRGSMYGAPCRPLGHCPADKMPAAQEVGLHCWLSWGHVRLSLQFPNTSLQYLSS